MSEILRKISSRYMQGADQLLPPLAVPVAPEEIEEEVVVQEDVPPAPNPHNAEIVQKSPVQYGKGDIKGRTMYPRPDEQLHPNKKPKQQQYGPNTERQDELSTEYDSGPAPSHLGGGFEGASTKDILEGKVPLTMDSLGLPDYDLPEFETGADGTAGTGWRDADLKPLPGEETLHEDIRKWADTDRSAGGDGLQRLRRAYLQDVEAGQLGRDSMGFQEWLESKGFDPYNEMGYRGNRRILNKIAPMPTTASDDPDQAHRAQLRKDRVINSYLQRYGAESLLGEGGLTREEAEALYDDAVITAGERGENPVIAAGRALKGGTNPMQYAKDAQLRMNVQNRVSQNNRAQRFGVPVGVIAALDQFGDAATPEEAKQALMMGAMQYPYLGATISQDANGNSVQGPGVFQSLYNQMLAGEISVAQAQAEIAKATGKNPHSDTDSPYTNRQNMEEEGGEQGLVNGYSKWNSAQDWSGREPAEKRLEAGAAFGTELAAVRSKVIAGEPISPEEGAIVRSLLGPNPDRDAFEQLFGGGMSDEEYAVLKEQITGHGDRSWSEWFGGFMPDMSSWTDGQPFPDAGG